jgi:hypothetical protein
LAEEVGSLELGTWNLELGRSWVLAFLALMAKSNSQQLIPADYPKKMCGCHHPGRTEETRFNTTDERPHQSNCMMFVSEKAVTGPVTASRDFSVISESDH